MKKKKIVFNYIPRSQKKKKKKKQDNRKSTKTDGLSNESI